MSFGIKSVAGSEPLIKSQAEKNLRKAVSGERLTSAGDEAAGYGSTAAQPAVKVDVEAHAPTGLEPAAGSSSVSRAVLQEPAAAIKSSAQAADQIRARGVEAITAQFNVPKEATLKLLAA
jgi:hypothetical protein